MSSLLSDAAVVEIAGRGPWPEDACLYQPTTAILNDSASCLATATFLKMCRLPFTYEYKKNAEHMSPSGRVPFIKASSLLISEFAPIVSYAAAKNHSLSSGLTDSDRADMKAYMAMLENMLTNAEIFLSWSNDDIYNQESSIHYGSEYNWPLSVILPWRKRRNMNNLLNSKEDWKKKTTQEALEEIRKCCRTLKERLGEQSYFFGDGPTELDALAFGHLYCLSKSSFPGVDIASIINEFDPLISFIRRIESTYFQGKVNMSSFVYTSHSLHVR